MKHALRIVSIHTTLPLVTPVRMIRGPLSRQSTLRPKLRRNRGRGSHTNIVYLIQCRLNFLPVANCRFRYFCELPLPDSCKTVCCYEPTGLIQSTFDTMSFYPSKYYLHIPELIITSQFPKFYKFKQTFQKSKFLNFNNF